MKKFANRLVHLLEENHLTQRELSKHVGVTEVTISRYISDDREPKADILSRIADFFNVSTDYLLGRTDDKQGKADPRIDAPLNDRIKIANDLIEFFKQQLLETGRFKEEELTQEMLTDMLRRAVEIGKDPVLKFTKEFRELEEKQKKKQDD